MRFKVDTTFEVIIDLDDNPYGDSITYVVNAYLTLYYEYNIMIYEICVRETPGLVITLCFWRYTPDHLQLFEWLHVNHGCILFQGHSHHGRFIRSLWKLFFQDEPYSIRINSFAQTFRYCVMIEEFAVSVMSRIVFAAQYGFLSERKRRYPEVGR
ncbi:MAG: hypothetical protein B7Z80_00920 [Rhodospirillales bacterium 20-64-7]|nr:MAG: hypothetical protein B7Z80_00920 [Rhodospirillales bacterium 20-64-7]